MPVGVIVDASAVALGGIIGCLIGGKFKEEFKEKMNLVFGICAMCMGISGVILVENLPAVVFSVVVGTAIGLALKLGKRITNGFGKLFSGMIDTKDEEMRSFFLTVLVLFCAGGTGIYGALDSGMTGNHTILLAKAIMDFFTAMIFAATLGKIMAFVAIPQFVILIPFFLLAKVILPLTTPSMINDFKACGGFLLMATSLRMLKLKDAPAADMIPAMAVVMPVSFAWTQWILPLIMG